MLEGRKERCTYGLKMHSLVLCAPAAGCCLAAATFLNCSPSPAKTRIDGLHKLNGSCKRGALGWAAAGESSEAAVRLVAERGCPLLELLRNGSASARTPGRCGVTSTVQQNLPWAESGEGTHPAACTEEPACATSNTLRFCANF